jgi:hypothetical protein
MTETETGDVVFSFCDTQIKAIGVITGPYQSSPKPTEFGSAGDYWSHEGWYVPVRFVELKSPIRPKDHMSVLGPALPDKYSPLQPNGNSNQGVYLASVPAEMAAVLRGLLQGQVEEVEGASVVDFDPADVREQQRLSADTTITETQKQQLVNARVGQGLFRSRVEMIEPACRITGVADRRFLRASHVKPWATSTNAEKLDGNNGLMLAPHVDHLFDKGFISFSDDGSALVSPLLPQGILTAWDISLIKFPKPLRTAQAGYMAFHRENVFKSS